MSFWAYMLHCRGGVFYTGHTDGLDRRIAEHQSGLVEGFTQGMLPVELVWSQEFPTRYEALTAEKQIKGWSRKKKLALIRGDWDEISRLADSKNGPSTGSGRTGERENLTPNPVCPEPVEGQPFLDEAAPLEVSHDVIATVRAEAANAAPRECCGLLLGQDTRIETAQPAQNVAPDPLTRFEIDPAALLAAHKAARAGGPHVLGYYHSHPDGHPVPSATDCEHASGDGRVWAIIARGDVTFWRDGDNGFAQLPYRSDEG